MVATERYPFIVASVISGENAEKAGIQENDSIVAINGVETLSFNAAATELLNSKGSTAVITLFRNGEKNEIETQVNETGKIGVSVKPISEIYDIVYKKYGFFESFPVGVNKGVDRLKSYTS